MTQGQIKTRAPQAEASNMKPENWELELTFSCPETVEEAVEVMGADSLVALAVAQYRVRFQSAVRTLAESGKSDEEITAHMATWKPGDRTERDPVQNLLKNFGSMSPEEQAKLLAQLQAQAAE